MSGVTVKKYFQCFYVCLFSLWAACALASSQTPASDFLIAPDDTGEDNLTPIQRNGNVQLTGREYLEAIEDIESEYGAYDPQLSQHLAALGKQYQAQGEHNDAIELFKRAMHVQRINYGLYDMGQAPILEDLIESQVALGQWEDANDRYQYLYWLNRRNYGTDDPRMLPIINKLSNWHLNAYALNVSNGLFYHLINAHNLYQIAADIVRNAYGRTDLRMIEPLRGLTASSYFLATYQAANQNKMSVSNGSMPASEEDRAQLQQYIINSYNSGRSAINQMVDVYSNNPDAPPTSEVRAQVALGDWHLLFGKWHSAMEIYQDSYQKLQDQQADPTTIAELFGKPMPLPDLPLIDIKFSSDINTEHFVLARFDVTAYGRARKIEIVDAHPSDDNRIRSRVRKTLKQAKFRPRFDDGKAVDTKAVTHRYLFSDNKP
ncbi:tetratricopeptide repeat protein [Simiduia aestuariiviva]|uniref:Tetratricopeptide (TPR) repeat protein n=1 Tax=Simiduia aestuariiviva TaxID=1510459 RepID=A0A839UQP1_9GAMM|nr:tetratricopeptide repeat protein [Simiduia aestuariiviva]MBB3168820.1 tetratricopeptide (TPR) repeat protein [Simiduia aestuariiviva]